MSWFRKQPKPEPATAEAPKRLRFGDFPVTNEAHPGGIPISQALAEAGNPLADALDAGWPAADVIPVVTPAPGVQRDDPTKPLIICPCHSRVHPGTVQLLSDLQYAHGWEYRPWYGATGVDRVRSQAASEALTRPQNYWFWCDDDNFLPVKKVLKMWKLMQERDFDVFAAVVPVRRANCRPNFAPLNMEGPVALGEEGGPLEARSLGLALAFTHRRVFEKLRETLPEVEYNTAYTEEVIRGWPFFLPAVNPETKSHYGEDYSFCERARQAGFKLWVDTSAIAWHSSEHILTLGDIVARFREEQEKMVAAWHDSAELI